jgi:hypothetical protein
MKFAQTFHLCVGGQSGYYCHNDLFRLNYGWASWAKPFCASL